MLLKPNQAHRVIKDAKQAPALLQPITTRDNAAPVHLRSSSASENGSILPRIDSVSSANDRDQLEQMKRRVKELEKENFKLSHHVSQAEQSIKNYRGFLANRPSSSSMPSTTRDYAVQTDVEAQNQALQINALTERAEKAEAKLTSITTLNADLLHKNNEFLKENKRLREQLDRKNEDDKSSNQQLLEKIALQEKQIKEFEDNLAAHASNAQSVNVLLESKLLKSVLGLKDLRQSARTHKSQIESEISELKDRIKQDYEAIIVQIVTKFMQESKQFEGRINQLMNDKYQSDILINRLNHELSTVKQEMDQLVILHQKEQALYLKQIHQHQQSPNAAAAVLNATPSHNKLHPLHSPENLKKHGLITPNKHSSHISSTDKLHPPSDHGADDRALISEYRTKLQEAAMEVNNLQVVHAAEIKAIQHISHVKELIRVAKERETSLIIDKLTLELKHFK